MKPLISFIILAITSLIILIETKHSYNNNGEDQKSSDKKWIYYNKKWSLPKKIVNRAIRKYNKMYHKHYKLKRIEFAEKNQKSRNTKIRVAYVACDTTCRKFKIKKRKNKKYKICTKYKCNYFRATYEKDKSKKSMIWVRNLDNEKGTGKSNYEK
uniref:Uncharacterized protein n=1 Tax=Strongyloides venezuelensis TaxID=75913 RepID=A0A0K0EZR0_STRVS